MFSGVGVGAERVEATYWEPLLRKALKVSPFLSKWENSSLPALRSPQRCTLRGVSLSLNHSPYSIWWAQHKTLMPTGFSWQRQWNYFPAGPWVFMRVDSISQKSLESMLEFRMVSVRLYYVRSVLSLSGTNLEKGSHWFYVLDSPEMGSIWWKLCISWKGSGNACIYVALREFGGRDWGKISGKDFILPGILLPLNPSEAQSRALCVFFCLD